jgi:hypothetical protein
MTQIPAGNQPVPTGITQSFAHHSASTAWERVVVEHSSGIAVWACHSLFGNF